MMSSISYSRSHLNDATSPLCQLFQKCHAQFEHPSFSAGLTVTPEFYISRDANTSRTLLQQMLDTQEIGKRGCFSNGRWGGRRGTSFKRFQDAPGGKCTRWGRLVWSLTFLRLFEAIVLGQPLGVRHKHVVFELRVLLHQQERLTNRQVKGRGGEERGQRARGRRCDEDFKKKRKKRAMYVMSL